MTGEPKTWQCPRCRMSFRIEKRSPAPKQAEQTRCVECKDVVFWHAERFNTGRARVGIDPDFFEEMAS